MKQKALLDAFGTIDKIMRASVEELSKVEGVGRELAEKIKNFFQKEL